MNHFGRTSGHPLFGNPDWVHPEVAAMMGRALHQHRAKYQSPDIQAVFSGIRALPDLQVRSRSFHTDIVTIGEARDVTSDNHLKQIAEHLENLIIWRKGPFQLFGIKIDAEWRSDMKWNRILSAVGTLTGQRVLDVGASSGYYLYRMSSLNPEWVLGIDPCLKFKLQFETLQKFAAVPNLFYELLKLEDMKFLPDFFDTVFCLGILSHQRSPLDALAVVRRCLRDGGRLFLETLVLPGADELVLAPEATYAGMPNVYLIPTVKVLMTWLKRSGFAKGEVISVDRTTTREQRNSRYCPFPARTLEHFLDPRDRARTLEGYPSPTRVCIASH